MDYQALLLRLVNITVFLIGPFAAIFSRIETLIFHLLRLPTTTSFRMFPPKDLTFIAHLPGGDPSQFYAASALLVLLFAPYLAYKDRHIYGTDLDPMNLTSVLWKRSRALALVPCLGRVWFITALWNYIVLKEIEEAMARGWEDLPNGVLARHPVGLMCSMWLVL